MVRRVTHCCCGVPLKTAGLILAVLGLLTSSSAFFQSMVDLGNPDTKCEDFSQLNLLNCDEKTLSQIHILMVGTAFNSFISFVLAICLMIGVVKENPLLVMIYVIVGVIYVSIFAVGVTIIGLLLTFMVHPMFLIMFAIIFGLTVVLPGYFLVVLYSLKCEFEEKNNRGAQVIYNQGVGLIYPGGQTSVYNPGMTSPAIYPNVHQNALLPVYNEKC